MRVPPSLVRQAYYIDPLLVPLLKACRDLQSAQNELRWLREHLHVTGGTTYHHKFTLPRAGLRQRQHRLKQLCLDRSRGKPLQYILGTEYFGDLEIICEPGVLIPRQDTANMITHLVKRLEHGFRKQTAINLPKNLRVLDLCTGTGCMSFLFRDEFMKRLPGYGTPTILGIDISAQAIKLANANKRSLAIPDGAQLNFVRADILAPPKGQVDETETHATNDAPKLYEVLEGLQQPQWDILVANPPYISPKAFRKDTARSVRDYEPELALVPPQRGTDSDEERADLFYPHLLSIAEKVGAKIVLFEVGGDDQAMRVAPKAATRLRDGTYTQLIQKGMQPYWQGIELWRDDLEGASLETKRGLEESVANGDCLFYSHGAGNDRAVFMWREEVGQWLAARPLSEYNYGLDTGCELCLAAYEKKHGHPFQ